jgi:hypothetical protein
VGIWAVDEKKAIRLAPFGKLSEDAVAALGKHVADRYHGLIGAPR